MKFIKSLCVTLTLLVSGCAVQKAPELTPLQIQALQTRDYTSHKNVVFPSVISVFQDLGYTIKNADKETGIIMAESAAKSDSTSRLFGVSSVSQTSATAFVEEIGKTHRSLTQQPIRTLLSELRTLSLFARPRSRNVPATIQSASDTGVANHLQNHSRRLTIIVVS